MVEPLVSTQWFVKVKPLAEVALGLPLSDWRTPFEDTLFEVKFDGFRALAHLEDGRCRLVNVFTRFTEAQIR